MPKTGLLERARTDKQRALSPWLKLYYQYLQNGYTEEEAFDATVAVLGPPPPGSDPRRQGGKGAMPKTASIFDRARRNLGRSGPEISVLPRVNARKAITQDSAPTIVEPETADRLIDYIVDESQFIGMARTERMNTNVKHLRFVDISTGLLRPGGCETDDSNCDHGTVTGTAKQLSTKEFKAAIPICDNILEDNIEGAAFEDHVLRMVGEQIANELEILGFMGDPALSYTSPDVNDATMALVTGWYQQMQNGHVLNAVGSAGGRFIDLCKFTDMEQALPTKYRRNRNIRVFMPDDMHLDFLAVLKNRGTNLGDGIITGQEPLKYGRRSIEPLALLPTDMRFCTDASVGGNGTFMFEGDPENFVFGVQRQITFERERKGCQGRTYLIWTLRVDFLVENEDETVLYDCMDVGNCVDCGCPGD